jgi:hypothetical protein
VEPSTPAKTAQRFGDAMQTFVEEPNMERRPNLDQEAALRVLARCLDRALIVDPASR